MEEGVDESRMCVPWLPVYASGCEFLGKLEPPACVARAGLRLAFPLFG